MEDGLMGFFDDVTDTVDKAKDTVDDTVDKAQDAVDTVTGGGSSDSDSSDTSDSSSSARDTSDSTGSRSSSSSSSSSSSRSRSSSSSSSGGSSDSSSDDSSGVVDAVSSTVDDVVGGGVTGDRDTNVVDETKEMLEGASEPEPDIKDRIDDAVGGGLTGDRSTSLGDNKVKDRVDEAVGGGLTGDKDTNVAQEAAQDIKSDLARGADRARVKRAKDRKPVEVKPDDINTPDPVSNPGKLTGSWDISASDPVERQQQLREKAADRFTEATVPALQFTPQQIQVEKTDQGLQPSLSESARGEIERFQDQQQKEQIREEVASQYSEGYSLADISPGDVVVDGDSIGLTDEGKSEIREEQLRDLDAQVDLQAGEDLVRGEDYTVTEKDGKLEARLIGDREDKAPAPPSSESQSAKERSSESWTQVDSLPADVQPPVDTDPTGAGSSSMWGQTETAQEIESWQDAQEPGLGSGAASNITPHAGMSLDQAGLAARQKREEIFAERAESGWESLTSAEAPSLKEIGAMNFQAAEIVERQTMGAGKKAGDAVNKATRPIEFVASPATDGPEETGDRAGEAFEEFKQGDVGGGLEDLGSDNPATLGGEQVRNVPGTALEWSVGGVVGSGLGAAGQAYTTIPADLMGDATTSRKKLGDPEINAPDQADPGESPEQYRREVARRTPGLEAEDVEVTKQGDEFQIETDLGLSGSRELVASQTPGVDADDVFFEGGDAYAYTEEGDGLTPSERTGVKGQMTQTAKTQAEMVKDKPVTSTLLIAAPLARSGTGFVRGYRSGASSASAGTAGRFLSADSIGDLLRDTRGQSDMAGLGKSKGSSKAKITAEDLNVPRSETSSSVVKRNVPRASKAKREIFSRQFSSEKPSKTSYKTETTPISEKISPRSPISKSANVGGRTASQGIKQRLRSSPPTSSQASSITSSTTQARATATSPTLDFNPVLNFDIGTQGALGALAKAQRQEVLVKDKTPPGTIEDTTVPGKPETATVSSLGPLARSDTDTGPSLDQKMRVGADAAIATDTLLGEDLSPAIGTKPSVEPTGRNKIRSDTEPRVDQPVKADVDQATLAKTQAKTKQRGRTRLDRDLDIRSKPEPDNTPWKVPKMPVPRVDRPRQTSDTPRWRWSPDPDPEGDDSQNVFDLEGGEPTTQTGEPGDAIGPGWMNEFIAGQAGVSRSSPGVDTLEDQPQTSKWSGTLPVEGEMGESADEFEEALDFFGGSSTGFDFTGGGGGPGLFDSSDGDDEGDWLDFGGGLL